MEVSEALQDAQKDLEADQGANPNMLYKTGYSTNTIWVVRSLGIDPSTGRELYLDRFGEPTFTWDSRDLTACGVAEPKYQGNLSTMFRYKGFSANLSFGYRFGGQLYNSTLIEKVENTDFRENVGYIRDVGRKPEILPLLKVCTSKIKLLKLPVLSKMSGCLTARV